MSKYKGYIGSYTRRKSTGIRSFNFDLEEKHFETYDFLDVENPTYLALSEDKQYLYSSMSRKDLTGVLSLNLKTLSKKELLFENEATPCYVSRYNNILLASNYHHGNFDIYSLKNNMLEKRLKSINHTGSGPNTDRQESSHIHFSEKSPLTEDIFVTDLGADKVYVYDSNFNIKKVINLKAGSGPRHIAFHNEKKILYVFTELTNEVYEIDYSQDEYKITNSIATISKDKSSQSDGAAIRISKDNRFLYVSNRGDNSISILDISEKNSMSLVDIISTEGDHPRDFNITPDGNYLLAANMNTDNLVLFKVNKETGKLKLLKDDIYSPEPVSIVFI